MPCPGCGRRIKYGPEDAGTEAFCPHCDTPVILDAPADAVPPPPMPKGQSKAKLFLIPAIAFAAVFGLIVTAAMIVKAVTKKKTTKVVIVDGKEQIIEVEVEDGKPRKASPKVKLLPGYKRPLKTAAKKKLVFDNPTPRKGGDPAQLLGHKLIKADLGNMQYVVGIVTNHTGKRYFDVEAFFDLYDDKGKKIGEAKDYLGILPPNGSWELKATIFDRGATSAKLRKIDKQAE